MGTHLVIQSLLSFSMSLRAVLISVEFRSLWSWARGGTTFGWWRELELIPPASSFISPSLKETVAAVGLLDGSWHQQSSMRLHKLSSSPRSILACGWGLAGRLADFTTLLRNNDQQLISLNGGSPENIWGGESMESFSEASNYCEPHRSSSQSCRHQKLH